MALTRCPSCNASVLDEDAETCPFCGAPMNGGKPAAASPAVPVAEKPAAPAAAPKPAARPAETAKPIKLAPRPAKGRTARVICPMCDAAGFVEDEEAVAGKAVLCPNPSCTVPVYVVPRRSVPKTAAAPEKASNKAAIVIGSILTTLILAGVGGLIAFLQIEKAEQEQTDGPDRPAPTPLDPVPDETPDPSIETPEKPVVAEFDPEPYETLRDRSLERVAALPRSVRARGLLAAIRRDAAVTLVRAGRVDEADEQIEALRELDVPAFLIEPLAARAAAGAGVADDAEKARELIDRIPARGADGVNAALAVATISTDDAEVVRRALAEVDDDAVAAAAVTRGRAAFAFRYDYGAAAGSEPFGGYADPLAVAGFWAIAVRGGGADALDDWLSAVDPAGRDAGLLHARCERAALSGGADIDASKLTSAEVASGPAWPAAAARAAFVVATRGDAESAAAWRAIASTAAEGLKAPEEDRFDLTPTGLYETEPQSDEEAIATAYAFAELARARATADGASAAVAAFGRAIEWARAIGPAPRVVAEKAEQFEAARATVEFALAEALGLDGPNDRRNAANRYRRHLRSAQEAAVRRRDVQLEICLALAPFDALGEAVASTVGDAPDELFDGEGAWRGLLATAIATDRAAETPPGGLDAAGRLEFGLADAVAAGDPAAAAAVVNAASPDLLGEPAITAAATYAAFELLAGDDFATASAFVREIGDALRRSSLAYDLAARAAVIEPPERVEAFVLDRNVDPATKFAACRGIVAGLDDVLTWAGRSGPPAAVATTE